VGSKRDQEVKAGDSPTNQLGQQAEQEGHRRVASAVRKEDEDPAARADVNHAFSDDQLNFVFSDGSISESGAYHSPIKRR
jgi:hypothetical protein